MKRFISLFAALFWAISIPALPPPIQPNKATTNAVPPYVESSSGLGTNNIFRAPTITADPNGTNMVRTMTVTMRTNQDLVIQDQYGNDLLSIRRSRYGAGTNSEYFFHFGSVGSPIVDMQTDLATGGADLIWTINGNLKDSARFNTDGGILELQYLNPTYEALGATFAPVFDNYGNVSPLRITSRLGVNGTLATVGSAAGIGATVTGDGQGGSGNDTVCQLTLTTGTGTSAGTVLTYAFDDGVGPFTAAPTVAFDGGNPAGAQSKGLLYITCTTTVMTLTALGPLDTSTLHKWSFHIIQ